MVDIDCWDCGKRLSIDNFTCASSSAESLAQSNCSEWI